MAWLGMNPRTVATQSAEHKMPTVDGASRYGAVGTTQTNDSGFYDIFPDSAVRGVCASPITHSSSLTVVSGQTVICMPQGGTAHNEASFYRAFTMSAFGVAPNEEYNITSVDVGIDANAAGTGTTQPITVRLYAKTGAAFPSGFPNIGTQIATVNLNVVDGTYTLNVPVTATVPAGTSQLIMEVFAPSGIAAGHLFQMGGNSQPETGPSYLRAPACGSSSPVTTSSIGFGAAHYVMAVNGSCRAVATPTPTPTPTFPVTNTNNNGPGSLRQAILDANAAVGANTITFDPSFSNTQRTIALAGEIVLANSVNSDVTIIGPGANFLTISGGGVGRIFYIPELPVVSISGMTLTQGNGTATSSGFGGAIYNAGDLTLTGVIVTASTATSDAGGIYVGDGDRLTMDDSTVSNNTAGRNGGGLYLEDGAFVTIRRSVISGNRANQPSASAGGGGIYSDSATLQLVDSTISANTSMLHGGGIAFDIGGTNSITRTTISGNSATGLGGGIFLEATPLTIANTTISGNTAAGGGGIRRDTSSGSTVNINSSTIASNTSSTTGGGIDAAAAMTVFNTLIGNNTATGSGPDVNGPLASNGYNLIENTSGATITGMTASNITGQDPNTAPLDNYGGLTQTHALNPGSPAIDRAAFGTVADDQRSLPRPVDNPNIPNAAGGNGADIGSFEAQATVLITVAGRVTTPTGLGLRNARVSLTDSQGVRRTVTTTSFGFYSFADVTAVQTYTISVASNRYRFASRSIAINDNLSNVDFQGLE